MERKKMCFYSVKRYLLKPTNIDGVPMFSLHKSFKSFVKMEERTRKRSKVEEKFKTEKS